MNLQGVYSSLSRRTVTRLEPLVANHSLLVAVSLLVVISLSWLINVHGYQPPRGFQPPWGYQPLVANQRAWLLASLWFSTSRG